MISPQEISNSTDEPELNHNPMPPTNEQNNKLVEQEQEEKQPIKTNKITIIPPPPPGISKSQWKKQYRRQRMLETKEEYIKIRKQKRKDSRAARRAFLFEQYISKGQPIPEELRRPPRKNPNQVESGVKIVIDCGFDELMTEREIISLSGQLTRSHSANKRAQLYVDVKVANFGGRLETRFKSQMSDSHFENWEHFEFSKGEEGILSGETVDKEKIVYLSADTDEVLETLEPGMTYVIGGIVDKNRHKNLCLNKAKKLGIPTRKLPLDEYIKVSGRRVLTTEHVVELMLKYLETHDWKLAFQSVLPARKLEVEPEAEPEQTC